jgi:hypothetical protein
MTDQTAWENIPHATPETGDIARARIALVLDKDPFVRMLAPEIRGCMAEGIATKLIFDRPQKNSVIASSHESINRETKEAMAAMPLGFLTDGFVTHVQSLIAFALRPHPEYDDWHRPV